MTWSMGALQMGHGSPRFFKICAQVQQQQQWPVSPCIRVAFLGFIRQMIHSFSSLKSVVCSVSGLVTALPRTDVVLSIGSGGTHSLWAHALYAKINNRKTIKTERWAMSRYFSSFYKSQMSCPQLNSKNNGPGLLSKTILCHLFHFLSSVATDGKDGNRLKLEKFRLNYSSLDAISTKNTKKLIITNFLKRSIFCIFKRWYNIRNSKYRYK